MIAPYDFGRRSCGTSTGCCRASCSCARRADAAHTSSLPRRRSSRRRRSAAPESTSSSTSSPLRRRGPAFRLRHSAAARAARDRPRARRDRGHCRRRAATASRDRHCDGEGDRPRRRAGAGSSGHSPISTTATPLDAAGLGVTVAWGLPYFERHVAEQAQAPSSVRPSRGQVRASACAPVSERSARHDPRAERRRSAHAQRQPRAHRRRTEDAVRRPAVFPDDEHPPRLRGRRLRRQAEPAEEDGDGGRRARCRPHPRDVRAVPRLHVDAEGRARPAPDRESRDARLHRPARRLLPRRHAHAPLASRRGPRGVVPQLRLRRACAHDVPSRA